MILTPEVVKQRQQRPGCRLESQPEGQQRSRLGGEPEGWMVRVKVMKKMKMKESHCHLQGSNQPESGARLFNPIQNRTFVYRSINPNRMPLGTAELERGAEAVRFNLIRRRKVLANPHRIALGATD